VQLPQAAQLYYRVTKPRHPREPKQSFKSRNNQSSSPRKCRLDAPATPLPTDAPVAYRMLPRRALSYDDTTEAEGYCFASTVLNSDPQGPLEAFLSRPALARARCWQHQGQRRASSAGVPFLSCTFLAFSKDRMLLG
jgi:hypothetical protein